MDEKNQTCARDDSIWWIDVNSNWANRFVRRESGMTVTLRAYVPSCVCICLRTQVPGVVFSAKLTEHPDTCDDVSVYELKQNSHPKDISFNLLLSKQERKRVYGNSDSFFFFSCLFPSWWWRWRRRYKTQLAWAKTYTNRCGCIYQASAEKRNKFSIKNYTYVCKRGWLVNSFQYFLRFFLSFFSVSLLPLLRDTYDQCREFPTYCDWRTRMNSRTHYYYTDFVQTANAVSV